MTRTLLCTLVLAILATAAVAEPLFVIPGSQFGPAYPGDQALGNRGLEFPRSFSWAVSRAMVPMPEGLPTSCDLKITVLFTACDDLAGDVNFRVGLHSKGEGGTLNAGSYTAYGDAVPVDGEENIIKKQVMHRTVGSLLPEDDLFIVTLARNIYGSTNLDTYEGTVGVLQVMVELDEAVAVNDDLPEASSMNFTTSPNPFNPATSVSFDLPREAEVNLNVYDPKGRLVETLVDGQVMGAGHHSLDFTPRKLSSGVYMVMLAVDDELQVRKVSLVK